MVRRLLLVLMIVAVAVTTCFYFAINYQRPLVTVNVVDDRGEKLELLRTPERIVVLTPSAGRLVALLQPDGRIVGVSDDLATLFPQAESLGLAEQVAATRIVAMRPDLVVLGPTLVGLSNQLTDSGVKTFLLAPESIDQTLTGIERVGVALERSSAAAPLRDQLAQRLQDVRDKVERQLDQPKVVFWLDDTFRYPEKDGFIDNLIYTAGGQNIAALTSETPVFTPADGLLALPDVIIGPQTVIDAIRVDPRWKDIAAVLNNRLHPLPDAFTLVNWDNLIDRLEVLYEMLYAEGAQP